MPRIPQHRGWQRSASSANETYKKFPVLHHGFLYYAEGRQSLAAHCTDPLCNHKNCRVNRSMTGCAAKYTGRPVGFLLAWLFAGGDFLNDRDGHQKLGRRSDRHDPRIDFAERLAARTWAQKHMPEVLLLERALEVGETEEPTEVAY